MKQRVSFVVCAVLACLVGVIVSASAPPASASSQETTGTIVVTIRGEIVQTPTFVSVNGPSGVQLQVTLGRTAVFTDLAPGSYTVSVSSVNGTGSQTATVSAGATTEVNFFFGLIPIDPPIPFPFSPIPLGG